MGSEGPQAAVLVVQPAYLLLALRRFYAGGWVVTGLKLGALVFAGGLVIAASMLLTLAVTLASL